MNVEPCKCFVLSHFISIVSLSHDQKSIVQNIKNDFLFNIFKDVVYFFAQVAMQQTSHLM